MATQGNGQENGAVSDTTNPEEMPDEFCLESASEQAFTMFC